MLCDLLVQTDNVLQYRRPDIVVSDKKKKKWKIINLAVPGDQNKKSKEQVKF